MKNGFDPLKKKILRTPLCIAPKPVEAPAQTEQLRDSNSRRDGPPTGYFF